MGPNSSWGSSSSTPSATTHTSEHTINKPKQVILTELEERINRKRRNKYYLWDIGRWIGGNRLGDDVVKFGINLG
jgi:hypothetical protein